jgi:phospholipid transport system substrate-binding protein
MARYVQDRLGTGMRSPAMPLHSWFPRIALPKISLTSLRETDMARKTFTARRTLIFASLALCAGLALPAQRAAAVPSGGGTATVQAFYSTLLDTMRNGPQLGAQGRYAKIAPAIAQNFDIPLMTRIAIGPDWATLTPAQQAQVTQAFEHYVAAVYAERFHKYDGEQLKVTGEEASPAGTVILSQIVDSSGQPVNINYLMRNDKIADVYLNGTISELATRRSEFGAILKTSGINGLIQALNNKAAALAS